MLVMCALLASCSATGKSNKGSSTQLQAKGPKPREIIIPVKKPLPEETKLPDSITEIQPNLDLKEQEKKGFRFTMSARGVDIRNVLFALSQEIDQNIVIDPNVNKLATVDLKNVTLEEALESLLTPLHLEYEMDKDFIRVRKEKMQTRTFFLNYIISKRRGSSNLSSRSGGGTNTGSSGTTSSSSASTTTAASGANVGSSNTGSTSSIQSSEETDIWAEITSGLKNIVTPSSSTSGGDSSSEDSGSSDADSAVASTDGDSSDLLSSLLGGGGGSSPGTEGGGSEDSSGSTSGASIQEEEERAYISVNKQAGLIVVKDYPDIFL